jgi:copper(I)-binding protein
VGKHGLLFVLIYFISLPYAWANLDISEAWVKYLPPVVPVRAGYMLVSNNTAQAINITKIESEVFTQIDIHETVEKDGMMIMRPVMPFKIPAGKTFLLAAGGLHLMMRNPDRVLKPGDNINVMLYFNNGETQLINMTVKKKRNE